MGFADAREICRITAGYASDLGTFTWVWVVRVDGTVQYQLIQVNGRRERNPWQPAGRLTPAQRRRIGTDQGLAEQMLAQLARERGHIPAGE